ncbi:MucR family transcriptional regulator [Acetobacteraceae bacterium KSS8]|uniref:MucR family transcriptional regulator n=1 Tax=Endosaccharibacter trunci TaxID=2812733 RepID=A0ABT1W8F5_9PROT|nr:MucR family transcriptional regulator [Acetobacteraceae bacterium KSS8]
MAAETEQDVLRQTARIVSAYLSSHTTDAEAVPALIATVRRALETAAAPEEAPDASLPARPEPAVPVRRSVFPDYIVCLEDGKKLKTLKRHLFSAYGMTPAQYRGRWGLPPTYPMVAPNYASARSRLAREIGLGRRRSEATDAT